MTKKEYSPTLLPVPGSANLQTSAHYLSLLKKAGVRVTKTVERNKSGIGKALTLAGAVCIVLGVAYLLNERGYLVHVVMTALVVPVFTAALKSHSTGAGMKKPVGASKSTTVSYGPEIQHQIRTIEGMQNKLRQAGVEI